uniref:FAR1 domain-containing protein n=1 Tax=Nelumbo nucifera TaxID=4432 RepID=A0A822XS97_NELNU|nr:TPA_asm: hypothetical protein HUJ06_025938 [Nelumbo nucifera]
METFPLQMDGEHCLSLNNQNEGGLEVECSTAHRPGSLNVLELNAPVEEADPKEGEPCRSDSWNDSQTDASVEDVGQNDGEPGEPDLSNDLQPSAPIEDIGQKDRESDRPNLLNVSQPNANLEIVGGEGREPEVGMKFDTWNDAYVFYSQYAKYVGFTVRIQGGYRTKCGVYKNRIFVCSFEGHRSHDKRRLHVKFR